MILGHIARINVDAKLENISDDVKSRLIEQMKFNSYIMHDILGKAHEFKCLLTNDVVKENNHNDFCRDIILKISDILCNFSNKICDALTLEQSIVFFALIMKDLSYQNILSRLSKEEIDERFHTLKSSNCKIILEALKSLLAKKTTIQEKLNAIKIFLLSDELFDIDIIYKLRQFIYSQNKNAREHMGSKNPTKNILYLFFDDYKLIDSLFSDLVTDSCAQKVILTDDNFNDAYHDIIVFLYARFLLHVAILIFSDIDNYIEGININNGGFKKFTFAEFKVIKLTSIFLTQYYNKINLLILYMLSSYISNSELIYSIINLVYNSTCSSVYHVTNNSNVIREYMSLLGSLNAAKSNASAKNNFNKYIDKICCKALDKWTKEKVDINHVDMIKSFQKSGHYAKYFDEFGNKFLKELKKELKARCIAQKLFVVEGHPHYPYVKGWIKGYPYTG